MINENQIQSVMGSDVHGSDGEKIGRAGQVYLDDQTGRPEWVTVNTGLFGTNESFVPLESIPALAATLPRCDAGCETCTGPTGAECATCASERFLSAGACVACATCATGAGPSASPAAKT